MTVTPTLYKIVPETLWQEARQTGVFHGAGIDLTDGFIHFSTAGQVKQTAALHFTGQSGLLLVAVDGGGLGDKLVFEPSRGGDLFPHLYADLPLVGRALGRCRCRSTPPASTSFRSCSHDRSLQALSPARASSCSIRKPRTACRSPR